MVDDPKGAMSAPIPLEVFVPTEACIYFGGIGPSTLFGQDAAGELVHVSEAASGASEGLICPDCAGRLVAKKGSVRIHHFAHASGADCIGAGETALHRLAKDLLKEHPEIALPELRVMGRLCEPAMSARLERIELETWEGCFRPDLTAEVPDEAGFPGYQTLYIEIRVTNAVVGTKLDQIGAKGNSAIEINLSGVDRAINRDELALLIRASAPRHWLFHHRMAEHTARIRAEQKVHVTPWSALAASSDELTTWVDKLRTERERGYSSQPARAFTESDIEAMLEQLGDIGPWPDGSGHPPIESVVGSAEVAKVAQALSRILSVVDGLEPKRLASWLRNGLVRMLIRYVTLPEKQAKLDDLASNPDEFRRQVQRLVDVENSGPHKIWGTAQDNFAIRALSSKTPEGGSILGYWRGGHIEECRKYTNMIVTPRQKPKWIRDDLPHDMPAEKTGALLDSFTSDIDWH